MKFKGQEILKVHLILVGTELQPHRFFHYIICLKHNYQWRIQDFPEGGGCANSQKYYFFQFFGRKPGGASLAPPLDPPMTMVKNKLKVSYILINFYN